MCALIYEATIPLSDLRRLSVECGACQTVVIVDLQGQCEVTVTFCPTCRHDFEPAIKDRVRALRSLLDAPGSSKECRFAFRVPAPPAKGTL